MTNLTEISDADKLIWNHYAEAWDKYFGARMALFQKTSDKLAVIKAGFDAGGRGPAIYAAQSLSPAELKHFLPELLGIASYFNGYTEMARELILSMPRDWLSENIEQYGESVLAVAEKEADYEVYNSILWIYQRIDRKLAIKLARRAVAHENEDFRELGEVVLAKFEPEQHPK